MVDEEYGKLMQGLVKEHVDPLILYRSEVGLARIALLCLGMGMVFGGSLVALISYSSVRFCVVWCTYAMFICLYHCSEFFITAYNHPGATTYDSFLVNQSLAYVIAICCGWMEFWVETLLFPEAKFSLTIISLTGLAMVIVGQCIRSLAMIQAGPSFTHHVADEKGDRQKLIDHGLYRYFRHPGYFGWFYWSIGTQLLLCNPLCTVLYLIAAWHFFRRRIPVEERNLILMFGRDYIRYQKRTFIGIPFVYGYDMAN